MKILLFFLVCVSLSVQITYGQRKMENLGRGVVAIRKGANSAFISWRLLGTEPNRIGFNLYRSTDGGAPVKLNTGVLLAGTNFTDNAADLTKSNSYFVKTVWNNTEGAASGAYTLPANSIIQPCFVIPLRSGPRIHLVSAGDLDGDGEYDFVVDRIDSTGNKLEAYKRDGTFLWVIDMGPNSLNIYNYYTGSSSQIDQGNWDGVTVYDMDGDGKAEVLLRTANGVVFGDGQTLTHSNDNVMFMSVIDGMTGAERAHAEIPNEYISVGPMGCSLGIGYLNGTTPSVVAFMKNRNANGSFNRLMGAWDFDGSTVSLKWLSNLSFGGSYSSKAADGHQIRIVDFDGDGKDDVGSIGFVVKGEDGSLMYDLGEQGIGHGDRWYVGKLDPDRPGLQGYGIQQFSTVLDYYYDAGTGKILWRHVTKDGTTADVGRGTVGDIDPNYPGYEVWEFGGLYNGPTNKLVSSTYPYPNFRIWWDGDLLSENLDGFKVDKFKVGRLLTAWHYETATYSDRGAPMFYGDIFGDWREEIVYTSNDYSKLLIFTTPIPSDYRIYTLPHNPTYRNCMTIKGYLQSHMVDYYLGHGMTTPPTPPIQNAKTVWKGGLSGNSWDNIAPNWVVNGTTGAYTQGDDVMFDNSAFPDTVVQLSGSLTPSSIKVISSINYSFEGSGSITGSTGLLKSGNGALSINTDCHYTDTTRVEEGKFYVNAAITESPLLVYRGATIGGSGTITKPVSLMKGSIIDPGAIYSAGTISFSSDLTLPSKTTCGFDVTSDSTGLAKPSDKIEVTGTLVIIDTMTIRINKIDGIVKPGKYPLITYTGSFTGTLSKVAVLGLFGQKVILKDSINTIFLIIEASRQASTVTWNGSSNIWDLQTTPGWSMNGSDVTFVANDSVIFDETGINNLSVKVVGTLPVSDLMFKTTVNSNYSLSGTGNIGGTGGLTKKGIGSLSLLTTNSFTGKTVIDSGRFVIGNLADAGVPSSIGANASKLPEDFQLNNAYLKYGGSTATSTNKGLTLGGTSDTLEITNPSALLSISGVITGTGNLVKTGAGSFVVKNQVNTFTGNTIIKEGQLTLGDETANTNGLNTGSITLDGGTLAMYSATASYTHFTNNLIVPAGSTGRIETDARCFLDGTLTGGGTLNYYVTYVRTEIAGDWSAFTGTINIVDAAGEFRFNNAKGLPNARVNIQTAGAAYRLGGGTFEVGELSGISTAKLTSGNWIVGGANTDATFNGVISGTSVTKKGTGSWTLTNANTYTGATSINGGTLIAANTSGSATGKGNVTVNTGGILRGNPSSSIAGGITVNSGGILTGLTTVNGAVSINNGGTLSPGNAVGTITVNNNVTMQPGSKMILDVFSETGACDKLNVTGTYTLSLNGVLEIINQSATPFVDGNAFKIFDCSNIKNGSLNSIYPATPGAGLVWDTTLLRSNGVLRVEDLKPPVVLVKSITVVLNSAGNVVVDPADVDNGSSDEYGIGSMMLSQSTFDCSNVGVNVVTFTVTDTNGNATWAYDTITVVDNTAPIVVTNNITVQLDQNGQATIVPAQIDNGSSDACGIASLTLDQTVFDCSTVGVDTVQLVVTDNNGNSSIGRALVTVEDNVAPVVVTKNVTVILSDSGLASITTSDVENGSSDACGIVSLSLDKTSFSCADAGIDTVTLRVTDRNGNVSSGVATVTVVDGTAPVARAKSIWITLVNGEAAITPAMIDRGSYDVCGTVSLSLSKSSFGCSDIGINRVTLTVTDLSGNVSTDGATVFVKGSIPSPRIYVERRGHTHARTDDNTIFLGYGSQSLKLTAVARRAVSYSWSPAIGLSNASDNDPVFTATQAGDFTFTVTVTNRYGCQESASVTIHVIDARCGNRNNKVLMCLRGDEVCVSQNSVANYLDKGYRIGRCNDDDHTGPDHGHDTKLSVYPNPMSSRSKVVYTIRSGAYKLEIFDLYGRLVETLDRGYGEGTETHVCEIHEHRYPGSVYIIRLVTEKGVEAERLIIEH